VHPELNNSVFLQSPVRAAEHWLQRSRPLRAWVESCLVGTDENRAAASHAC
jgi:hypothetical protein